MANEAAGGKQAETAPERVEVNSEDLRRDLTHFVNRAAFNGTRVIINRNGKPYAALIGISDLEKLESLSEVA